MTREGRLKAAYNLVQNNICSLVCIGGDGSLTGANLFRQEWSSLLEELIKTGLLTNSLMTASHFHIADGFVTVVLT